MKIPPRLKPITDRLEDYQKGVRALREQILTNTILVGQVPPISVNIKQDDVDFPSVNIRVKAFIERLSEIGVDEAATDSFGNAIGIIKGEGEREGCIIVAAHMDTVYHFDQEIHLAIDSNGISGPGIIDNSVSLGVQLSLPEILRELGKKFNSDIVLLGLSESLGESNLGGIREFLNNWRRPIRAAVILEGAELGRLNYFSRAMIRADINCEIPMISGWENKYGSNAILIMNDIINRILEIHLPQRPNTQIILGKIKGGIKHGDLALSSRLGLEIESTSDELVQEIYSKIEDIVDSIRHENLVDLRMNQISNVNASRLEYTHPLVKTAVAILEGLKVKPVIESSESELSIFLSHNIPAITVGVTHGENYHTENAQIEIEPMFAGIAQLIGLIEAIDKGIIDEQ
jgi:tripeptide aminopeptidase